MTVGANIYATFRDDFFKRRIKEAILIQKHDNFNQDIGLAVSLIWT